MTLLHPEESCIQLRGFTTLKILTIKVCSEPLYQGSKKLKGGEISSTEKFRQFKLSLPHKDKIADGLFGVSIRDQGFSSKKTNI